MFTNQIRSKAFLLQYDVSDDLDHLRECFPEIDAYTWACVYTYIWLNINGLAYSGNVSFGEGNSDTLNHRFKFSYSSTAIGYVKSRMSIADLEMRYFYYFNLQAAKYEVLNVYLIAGKLILQLKELL